MGSDPDRGGMFPKRDASEGSPENRRLHREAKAESGNPEEQPEVAV